MLVAASFEGELPIESIAAVVGMMTANSSSTVSYINGGVENANGSEGGELFAKIHAGEHSRWSCKKAVNRIIRLHLPNWILTAVIIIKIKLNYRYF